MPKNTNLASQILSKVESLTAIRDIEDFESSFLKTLAELLNIKDISIYKFNQNEEPCRLLRYSSLQPKSHQRVIQLEKTQTDNIKVPDEIKKAKVWIKTTNQVYSSQQDKLFFMAYPIVGLKGLVGYLSLNLYKQLTESETQIISSLLKISHNFYSLLEENQKDKLTGLLNRKTFDSNISKIHSILNTENQHNNYSGTEHRSDHQDNDEHFWLAIFDIDHFKRVNDEFGHVYGDEVLLLLSQIMKKTFRTQDLLFRFGGEEFISLIQVNNRQNAELILERFRKTMEDHQFPQVGQVTISIGATQILKQLSIASEIVGRADQALYHAKETGRNKLCFYEDLIAQGLISHDLHAGEIELFE